MISSDFLAQCGKNQTIDYISILTSTPTVYKIHEKITFKPQNQLKHLKLMVYRFLNLLN